MKHHKNLKIFIKIIRFNQFWFPNLKGTEPHPEGISQSISSSVALAKVDQSLRQPIDDWGCPKGQITILITYNVSLN